MTGAKKVAVTVAVLAAGTFGLSGVASAHDNDGHHGHGKHGHHGHYRHDHGLVGGLLHTVGGVLRAL
jgi:hypothetical protein